MAQMRHAAKSNIGNVIRTMTFQAFIGSPFDPSGIYGFKDPSPGKVNTTATMRRLTHPVLQLRLRSKPQQIKKPQHLRVSQPVFARYLNTSDPRLRSGSARTGAHCQPAEPD